MAHDVFISYSREDLSLIEPLVKDIEKRANVRCWIDWNGIESGSQFEDVIVKAIDSVKVVLFFLSENSMNSDYAKLEVNYAYNTCKKVVPIVLDGGSLRGWFLFKFGSVDFIDVNQERQYNKLINDLIGWCGTAAPTPIPQPKPAPTKTYKVGDYYDVVLKSVGGNKLMVVKAVKEMAGLSLLDAKILVDNAPGTLFEGVSSAEAKSAKSILESAGAEVAIVESGGQQNIPLAHKPQPATAKTYKVGDYYDDGKKQGVVFEVTADGKHGKIVSLTEAIANWAVSKNFGTFFNRDNPSKKRIGADAKYDGANNMSKVQKIAGWREKYPAFAWCADLGEGWYLPAIYELKKFTLNDDVCIAVNRTLATEGKQIANRSDYPRYWSSTEYDDSCAWGVSMFDGGTGYSYKGSSYFVRAVSAF